MKANFDMIQLDQELLKGAFYENNEERYSIITRTFQNVLNKSKLKTCNVLNSFLNVYEKFLHEKFNRLWKLFSQVLLLLIGKGMVVIVYYTNAIH